MSILIDDEIDTMIVLNETMSVRYQTWDYPMHVKHRFWLFVEGKAVSHLELMQLASDEGLISCSLETRLEEKRKGYANLIRKTAMEATGKELLSTGDFSIEGFNAFHGKASIYSGGTDHQEPTEGIISFVTDWDNLICN